MAIHPGYAEAILAGHKRVEFRKRPLAPDVMSVLIYATSPVQGIVGEFTIRRITAGSPAEVWNQFGDVGCIDAEDYDRYYANSTTAYAIVISGIRRFSTALPLSALEPEPTIPQSFMYLDRARLRGIRPDGEEEQPELFPGPGAPAFA